MTPDEFREIRKGAGLTQAKVAWLLGMGLSSINAMEAGTRPIELRTSHLMRLIRDTPGGLEFLRREAGPPQP